MGEKSRKTISSINLECWIWETIDRFEKNRSKFFSDLMKEEIKNYLIVQKLMKDTDEVSELYGEVYLSLKLYENRLLGANTERKPVRSKTLNINESFRKKSISIGLEKWLWDISAKIEPNRSLFFKKLFLLKFKNILISSNIIDEATFQINKNNEYYLMQLSQKIVNMEPVS